MRVKVSTLRQVVREELQKLKENDDPFASQKAIAAAMEPDLRELASIVAREINELAVKYRGHGEGQSPYAAQAMLEHLIDRLQAMV